ncbi:hypothetical protein [Cupriavidus sp. UME77]|uniref:hypothetical protein n=1 Tax=Cupriavidus sp. UME77 TaxID=1862321 RepID=UPI00160482DE|nr:hypothetical protein [Cupriavidus sp. UME77]
MPWQICPDVNLHIAPIAALKVLKIRLNRQKMSRVTPNPSPSLRRIARYQYIETRTIANGT